MFGRLTARRALLVLAIDTALTACSAAVVDASSEGATRALAVTVERRAKGHAERLAPMIDALLREADTSIRALDRVGVVVGPGGFAGVRVGLAFARALSLGGGPACVGVDSLRALAASAPPPPAPPPEDGFIAPIVDARRGQVYAALYDAAGRAAIDPFVATPQEAADRLQSTAAGPLTLCGDGAGPIADLLEARRDATDIVDPVALAALAAAAPAPQAPPAPLYLRPPDARPAKAADLIFGAP
ncbi:MAG: tRNA (adenosine(37)-N6)-threonylcarbamoyltransferase complex dimerization subunit type 1 TsaB [Pseudomonadota bacterium]